MKRIYYSMEKAGAEANVNIYGDICSYPYDGAVTAKGLATVLDELTDVSRINVYINSYGGEVAEGLAIYNSLKRHKAKVITHCDGFAASIASVIFMAGDERVMNESSLLMIHNAWVYAAGNADELRKQADDLDKITQASVLAYKAHSALSEEEIKALMDAETWILPAEALSYGFATSIESAEQTAPSQNVRFKVLEIIKAHRQEADEEEEETPPDEDEDTDESGETPSDDPDADQNEPDEPDEGEGDKEPAEEEKPSDGDSDGSEGDDPENDEKPAEWISGFFNAIIKM